MNKAKIKKVSAEELLREQDYAFNRVRNIQSELYSRGEVKHEFHSLVMKSIYSDVTPKLASKMLDSYNGGKGTEATNRGPSKMKAGQIAADIKSGNFHGCVSTIIFDDEGVLMDGQTRLQAILNSKTTCPMHVIMGVPREGMVKIDIGRKRTNADRFRLAGMFGDCSNAQARWYERIARFSCAAGRPDGVKTPSRHGPVLTPFTSMKKASMTDEHIEAEVVRLREPIEYIVSNLSNKVLLRKLPVLVAIAQWWVEVDSSGEPQDKDAKAFYNELMSGGRLSIGDPIFTLREKLLDTNWDALGHNLITGYRLGYGWTLYAINKQVNCEELHKLTKRTVALALDLP